MLEPATEPIVALDPEPGNMPDQVHEPASLHVLEKVLVEIDSLEGSPVYTPATEGELQLTSGNYFEELIDIFVDLIDWFGEVIPNSPESPMFPLSADSPMSLEFPLIPPSPESPASQLVLPSPESPASPELPVSPEFPPSLPLLPPLLNQPVLQPCLHLFLAVLQLTLSQSHPSGSPVSAFGLRVLDSKLFITAQPN